MKHSLILLSVAVLAVLMIIAFSPLRNFTGSVTKTLQDENITNEMQYEESENESITIEQPLQCPISCDDYNPCTLDWCNKTSNYKCMNSNLTGDFEGCKSIINECNKRTCISGKCEIVKISCSKDQFMQSIPAYSQGTNTVQHEEQQQSQEEMPFSDTENSTEPSTSPDHVIINEILTKSPLCNDKEGFEFIELFNPTQSPVSIGNWWVVYYISTRTDWDSYTWRKELPSDAQIQPNSYYLIAVSTYWDNCSEKPEWVIPSDYNLGYTAQDGKITASKGTIAIHSSFGSIVDAVGWGETNLYEGFPSNIESGKSIERKSAYIDTDNNLNDFLVIDVPTPKK